MSTPPGPEGDPENPLAFLFGGSGSADLSAALHQFADLLSWSGGPVNWDLARRTAFGALPATDAGDTTAATAQTADALRLADLWLDPVTIIPAAAAGSAAWTQRQWLESTLPVWQELVEPIAVRVVEAMNGALPAEAQALAGPLGGMMKQMGGVMFGAQIGQALASLAGDVLSSTDIGLPLLPNGHAALVPANIEAFGAGLDVPADELRLYVALREAAHQRLFAHVPWLRLHVIDLIAEYARGIQVDVSGLEEAMSALDPADPEAMQQALTGGMFAPQDTPAQKAALERLETNLALVAGWVDEVVDAAAVGHLPGSVALREMMRRRRAEGGPAEQTFATLVGLELRPRRLRDAAALWGAVRHQHGIDVRDALWEHPDLLPSAADLDDPIGFADRVGQGAWDADADWKDSLPGWDSPPAADPENPDAAPPEGPPPGAPQA
jgi:putative hydrolase